MEYLVINYTVFKPNGTIRFEGTIRKVKDRAIKRMLYLKNLYLSLIKFN